MKKVGVILVFFLLFSFWFWIYPNHIYNQEYFSFFENTVDYFQYYAGVAGGLSEWIGSFVSLFYRFPGVGAVLQTISAVLLFLSLSGMRLYRKDAATEWIWNLIPVSLLVLLQTHYTFLFGHTLQVLSWYAFFFIYSRIPGRAVRIGSAIVFCYPAIWLFGAAPALLWGMTIVVYESLLAPAKRLHWILLPMLLACAWGWRSLWLTPDQEWLRIFPGVKEFTHPLIAWLLYLWLPGRILFQALPRLFGFRYPEVSPGKIIWLGRFLLAGIWMWGWNVFYNPPTEHLLRLHRALAREDWQDILDANRGYESDQASVYVLTNLALSHQGQLPERALEYPQIGINGLMPPRGNSYFSDMYNAGVYEALGVTNEAYHWIFEAGVSHKDYPPAHLIKKQVEFMIKLGKEPAAIHYLRRLALVPFYSDWAQEQLQKTSVLEAKRFLALETFGKVRKAESRQVTFPAREDFRVGAEGPFIDLFQLADKHPENKCVRDYLLTGLLLERELGDFYYWFQKYYPENYTNLYILPRLYREALMLVTLTKIDTNACQKYGIPLPEQDVFRDYLKAYKSYGQNKEAARMSLREKYQSCYWYYLHFDK